MLPQILSKLLQIVIILLLQIAIIFLRQIAIIFLLQIAVIVLLQIAVMKLIVALIVLNIFEFRPIGEFKDAIFSLFVHLFYSVDVKILWLVLNGFGLN